VKLLRGHPSHGTTVMGTMDRRLYFAMQIALSQLVLPWIAQM
jgi:hypothetical protein